MTVVAAPQLRQMGTVRLTEVLDEQTGLTIDSDHGSGVQLQVLNPEYTLFLVDGEPLIGRTAGTLNLSRVALGNEQRMEIVKGPASALWGSEAPAGVVNIITRQPPPGSGPACKRICWRTRAYWGCRIGLTSGRTCMRGSGPETIRPLGAPFTKGIPGAGCNVLLTTIALAGEGSGVAVGPAP